MAKFLCRASYGPEGAKGLAKEGGTSRRQMLDSLVKGLGGGLESFYFAFGEADVYATVDLPDNITAFALSLAVNQSGSVSVKTTPLLTCEEFDQAAKKQVAYRAPGR